MFRFRSALAASVALISTAFIVVAGASAPAGASAAGDLPQDLAALLANPALKGAEVALVVRDADTGTALFDSGGGQQLLPASNEKLLTSAAALDVLGPDYRFTTSAATQDGDLYLKGTGDPTMLGPDYDALAAQVAASGVRLVRGDLVADDTWFDSTRLGTGWSWDDEPYYYSGQISALTMSPDTDYDAGSVIVTITPGKVGKAPKLTVTPDNGTLKIVNTATTGAAGSDTSVNVDRDHGVNTIRVSGTIAADADPDEEWVTVWDPTAYVAQLFRNALARHGVHVLGRTEFRATPAGAKTVASHQSMPLSQLLTPFLKLSNNMHAEILTKAIGRAKSGQGSWDAGIAGIKADLPSLGMDPKALRMNDGSGLSRMDSLTADELCDLLTAARGKPWFDVWYQALPIAGNPDRMVGGTLRNRMRNTAAANNLHGKTGSLTGVSSLSGYVTAANGQHLVFSMLSNNYLGGAPTSIQDAVGVRLAENGGTVTHLIPATPARTGNPDADLECSWTHSC
jgi:D-alanyl-D-alanine carboxypeptidase/D-alanyl-D-alanine-endopeptidase (penicillin-binding protein 4)